MFMVNSSREGTSFWARNKSLLDGAIQAALLFVGLKLARVAADKWA
jgi:hypothetical protein